MTNYYVTKEQKVIIAGTIKRIQEEVFSPDGSSVDPVLIMQSLQNIIQGRFNDLILRPVSGNEHIVIDACDGTETFSNEDVFEFGTVDDGKVLKDGLVPPTKKILVRVYEIVKDGTFEELFGVIGVNVDRLCLTEHQIISFFKNCKKWMHPNHCGTYFIFKSGDKIAVAGISGWRDGFRVSVHTLHEYVGWSVESLPRLVVPRITAR